MHPKLKGALLGHSFARRLATDITGMTNPPPEISAARMEVSQIYKKFYIFGNESFTVEQLYDNVIRAGGLGLDVVAIHCGTNDLTSRECDIDALVGGLMGYTGYLVHGCGVKHVTLLGVVNRTKCREVSHATFSDRAQKFNKKLKKAVKEVPGANFAYMKGFWRDVDGGHLPVKSWSDDGIHPSVSSRKRDKGMDKYRKNVRRCLLKGARHVDALRR